MLKESNNLRPDNVVLPARRTWYVPGRYDEGIGAKLRTPSREPWQSAEGHQEKRHFSAEDKRKRVQGCSRACFVAMTLP